MLWEYRVERIDLSLDAGTDGEVGELDRLRQHLNVLGSEEWELIGHHVMPASSGSSHLMFMKRPAREAAPVAPPPVSAFAGAEGWHYNPGLDKWFCDPHGRVNCPHCGALNPD